MTLDIKPMLRVFQEIANLIVELIFNLIHFPHNAHGTQRRLLPHVGISRGHPWRGATWIPTAHPSISATQLQT